MKFAYLRSQIHLKRLIQTENVMLVIKLQSFVTLLNSFQNFKLFSESAITALLQHLREVIAILHKISRSYREEQTGHPRAPDITGKHEEGAQRSVLAASAPCPSL